MNDKLKIELNLTLDKFKNSYSTKCFGDPTIWRSQKSRIKLNPRSDHASGFGHLVS